MKNPDTPQLFLRHALTLYGDAKAWTKASDLRHANRIRTRLQLMLSFLDTCYGRELSDHRGEPER